MANAERTLILVRSLYEYVLNETETFEGEDHIGANLAYLMGAITRNEQCEMFADSALLLLLRDGRTRADIAEVLTYINILPDE